MNQVNQTARPTRIAAWDLLKLFAIFLVVYGHCMQHLLEVDTRYNPMFLWITSFHMPLFMTLSGLFARNSFRASFKDYFRFSTVWYKRLRNKHLTKYLKNSSNDLGIVLFLAFCGAMLSNNS